MLGFRFPEGVLSFALLVAAANQHGNIYHDVFRYKTSHKAQADAIRLANAKFSSLDDTLFTTTPFQSAVSTASFQLYTNSSLPTNPAPSSACAAALTASIACNYTIQYMPQAFDHADLTSMCTSGCSTSLKSYRTGVASSCSSFHFSGANNQSYLATLAIDTISEAYFSSCRTDATSGNLCSDVMATFTPTTPSQGILGYPQNELCSSCMLGVLNTTLSYPMTYSNALYNTFQAALKTCGSSFASYNVTPPSSTSTIFTPGPDTQPLGSNSTLDAICAITGRNVTLTSAGNCSTIAQQFSITQDDILFNNPTLRISNCTTGITAKTTLCLPQSCTLYTVQANQTCNAIVSDVTAKGLIGNKTLTVPQLESFNPGLDTSCSNLAVMNTVCISPHGGFATLGNDGGAAVPNPTPTKVAPPPGQTAPGTTSACGAWYLVEPGNVCQQVALNNSITFDDLVQLNPEINANCTNLWASYYYCVAPFPPFASASGAPLITANFSSATLMTMPLTTAATPTPLPVLTSFAGVPAPTNVANGTITNGCGYYYTVESGDNCTFVEQYFNISDSDFQNFNVAPCPSPTVGSAVCVRVLNATDTIPPTPTNAAPGSGPNGCARWYTIASGDGCPSVELKFGLSASQFFALNPEVKTNCTNLALNEAYCVKAIGQVSAPVPTNAASGTDNKDCARYDTVISGDSCPTIESRNNITDSLFRNLNPEINAACTNIQLGVAYCVQAIPGFTAISASANPTPTNVATGTDTKDCAKYDTVISGDSCPAIESRNNITDSLFRTLNPEINAACTNIQLGVAYCVQAIPGFTATSNPTPTNVATGTDTKDCAKYDTVISGDSCPAIEQRNNITDSLFRSLNPEINSACTNIQLGEQYCVKAVPGFTPTSSAPAISAPTNIATGSWTNCTAYYTVVSGDNCAAIDTKFSIAFADFLHWNPEINTACSNLQLAAYCVTGSGACPKIHTVISGDSCGKLETSFSLTDPQLRSVNPWLDTNCDLQLGQNLCVALH